MMRLSIALFLVLVIGSSCVNAQAKVDCKVCVGFMEDFIDVLLNAILNGEIGGCADVCGKVNNTLDKVICNALCDYVGIKEFIKIINATDPDPIYMCDELNSCTHTDGGKVVINQTSSSPASGPVGTTFTIGMIYSVTSATSTGLLIIDVNPPRNGAPITDGQLVEGQAPGLYKIMWSLDTSPNSGNTYIPGTYSVVLGICAGDCTTIHPWGGVYATANANFTITK